MTNEENLKKINTSKKSEAVNVEVDLNEERKKIVENMNEVQSKLNELNALKVRLSNELDVLTLKVEGSKPSLCDQVRAYNESNAKLRQEKVETQKQVEAFLAAAKAKK